MWYLLRPVDASFLDTAKKRFTVEQAVALPPETVWDAFADSANWHHWFPAVVKAGYASPAPYGPGTCRVSQVGKHHYEETMIHWQAPAIWSYRIDRTTLPIAHAQLELTEFFATDNGTLVRWTIAADPRLLLWLMAPLMPVTMKGLLRKALLNLERYMQQ